MHCRMVFQQVPPAGAGSIQTWAILLAAALGSAIALWGVALTVTGQYAVQAGCRPLHCAANGCLDLLLQA